MVCGCAHTFCSRSNRYKLKVGRHDDSSRAFSFGCWRLRRLNGQLHYAGSVLRRGTHILYMRLLPRRAAIRSNLGYATALAAITIGYLGFVLAHIESQAEFIAVAIYGLIIFTMGTTAIFQQRPLKWWYVAAALLFILSDSLIVFGKYIAPLPNRSLWVMTTYYAAQGIFMTLHLNRKSLAD